MMMRLVSRIISVFYYFLSFLHPSTTEWERTQLFESIIFVPIISIYYFVIIKSKLFSRLLFIIFIIKNCFHRSKMFCGCC